MLRKILAVGAFPDEALAPLERLQYEGLLQLAVGPNTLTSEELAALLTNEAGGFSALLCRPTSGARIDATTLDRAVRPFFIATVSRGTDYIDVTRSPGVMLLKPKGNGNASAVAELTISKAIDLIRRVPLARESLQRGEFSNIAVSGARSLRGRTWACLGRGAQVKHLLRALPGLGLARILIWAPDVDLRSLRECVQGAPLIEQHASSTTDASEVSITYSFAGDTLEVGGMRQLDAVLGSADVSSIHLPHSQAPRGPWPKTDGLIDRAMLRAMKSGAMMVNVGRGELVKEEDVIEALQEEQLGGYSTDVLYSDSESQKILRNSRLGNLFWKQITGRAKKPLNLDITPHIGGSVDDLIIEMAHDVIAQLISAMSLLPPVEGGAHV